MPRDPVLFFARSDCFSKLENPHYYQLAGHGTSPEKEEEEEQHHDIWGHVKAATINPGGVKVDDNCLLLDFQGHDDDDDAILLDRPSMLSNCSSISIKTPPFIRASSSSSSLSLPPSSSTFLSFPSSSSSSLSCSSPLMFCHGVNEEMGLDLSTQQTLTSINSPQQLLANKDMVESLLLSSSPDLSMPPSAQSNIIVEPCFDVPDAEALVTSRPKEAGLDDDDDDVLSSLIMSNTYPSEGSSLDLVQEPPPFCVMSHIDDELSIDDIVAQESFGSTSSSLGRGGGGGCPNDNLAITDDCSDLLGSSRQLHQSLQDKLLHLHVNHGPGNMYKLQKHHHHHGSSSALDAFGRLNLSPSDSHGEFLLPPSLTHGKTSTITELEKTSLYNLSDSKDLIFTGVESVFSENPQSVLGCQGFYQYTKEEKGKRIDRYRQKRSSRNFSKKIKYACRKALADSRPRVRGRFAKTEEGGGGGGGWNMASTEQGRWSWRSLPSPPLPPSPFIPSYIYPSRMGLTSYHI